MHITSDQQQSHESEEDMVDSWKKFCKLDPLNTRASRVPVSSNRSPYLIKLFNSSDPEGNFGVNQLLDGLISISPLYTSMTNDLHVSI